MPSLRELYSFCDWCLYSRCLWYFQGILIRIPFSLRFIWMQSYAFFTLHSPWVPAACFQLLPAEFPSARIDKAGQKGYRMPELVVCKFKNVESGVDEAHGFGTNYLTYTRDFFEFILWPNVGVFFCTFKKQGFCKFICPILKHVGKIALQWKCQNSF